MSQTSSLKFDRLLQHARRGDETARDDIWTRYSEYLSLLARINLGRMLRTKVSQSDVVQETLLQADKHLDGFRGTTEQELLAWLRKIMAAQIAQQARHHGRQRRDVRLERSLGDQLDQSSQHLAAWMEDSESSPSMRAARKERETLLANSLAQIKPAHREVIILRSLEELTFEEVGAQMGRSTDAVKKLWVRALAKLREVLREQNAE